MQYLIEGRLSTRNTWFRPFLCARRRERTFAWLPCAVQSFLFGIAFLFVVSSLPLFRSSHFWREDLPFGLAAPEAGASDGYPNPEFSQRAWWQEFDSNRTLYVAPFTGMANTLQSMASALTIALHHSINVRFVLHHPWVGPAQWKDLFSFPQINDSQTFPDGTTSARETRSCEFGVPVTEWGRNDVRWVVSADGTEEFGCTLSCCWREPPFPESSLWFYRALKPALPLQQHIDEFKLAHEWSRYQWVGVHFRRTDNIKTMKRLMKHLTDPVLRKKIKATSAETLLPLEHYVELMQDIWKLWPVHDLGKFQTTKPLRFFLATDDDQYTSDFKKAFPTGRVISFARGIESSEIRNTVWGMQTGVIDLFLLASCHVIIGTPFSTFSEAASYIGGALLLEPNFAYENAQLA